MVSLMKIFPRWRRTFTLLTCLLLGVALVASLTAAPASAQTGGISTEVVTGGWVQAAAVTADGNRIVIGARDNTVRVVDAAGQPLWEFTAANSILGADTTSDGTWTVVASEDRSVYLLDAGGAAQWQYRAGQAMNNAAVAEDGSLVAATSDDRSFYVLDGSGNLVWREVLGIDVRAVAIYGTGERARVITGSDDGYVTIYDRDGGTLLSSRLDYDVQSLAVTANGRWIVAGTSDGLVSLLDGSNGQVVWKYKVGEEVTSVAMSADARTILAGSRDKKAYLLDGDGKLLQAFPMQSEVLATAISGDGAVLVIGSADNRAVLMDRHAAEASHTQSQARGRLINGIVLASIVVVLAAAVAYMRGTPAGRHVWRQGTARPRGLLRSMWRERIAYLMIFPTLALLLVFNYYPAFSGLFHAFTEWSPGARTEWVGLANFEFLLTDRFFLSSFRNTVVLVIVAILKTLTMPLLVAELIFAIRHNKARYWLRTLFIVPLILPLVVEILLWNNMYDPTIGLFNQTLIALGRADWTRAWYGDENLALGSIIFIGFPWVSAFALLVFYGGLISISEEIFDASKVDGASGFRRFLHIDLPMLIGQIKLLLILNFINAVQTFELVYLTTGGGPGSATYTPALELYYQAMRMHKMGVASAIGMVLFVIIMAGTIVNMRFVRSSTEYEA
jgi:ABC-type sugar transport system permease subunit/outer membrane protein assembly factor BamB